MLHSRHVGARPEHFIGAVVLCFGLLSSCGGNAPTLQSQHTTEITNSVTIPAGQDVFDPYILPIQPNATVTWHNADTVAHTIVTTPEQSSFLNPAPFTLNVAAGQSVTVTLTQPGVYYYYDKTAGDWSPFYSRVIPKQGVPRYPMAMEGIIWVQGPIPGLPTSAQNHIVHLRDEIATFVVAVKTGGTVSWQNQDTDPHFFQTVLGWDAPINPVEVGVDNLLGEDAMPPDGQTRTITFNTPGLYYYFCFSHATVDPLLLRVYARKMASEYPVDMEGFVLVTDA